MEPENNILIREVIGTVIAVSSDGTSRELSAGSYLLPGDTVQTQEGSMAILLLPDGNEFTVPELSTLTLPPAGTSFSFDADTLNSLLSLGVDNLQTIVNENPENTSTENTPEKATDDGDESSNKIGDGPDSDDTTSASVSAENDKHENQNNEGSEPFKLEKHHDLNLFGHKKSDISEFGSHKDREKEEAVEREKLLDMNDYDLKPHANLSFERPDYSQKGFKSSLPEETSEQLGNSPINLHHKNFFESGQGAFVFGSQIQPIVILENVGATADIGTVLAGQMLNEQSGILGNDYGAGIRLISVNGESISSTGATIIQGVHGLLTIQPDGTYTYSAADVDIQSDLVAYWGFNQPTSDTVIQDQSLVDSQSDTGTLQENAQLVSGGLSGNALRLDGTGDYVSIGNIRKTTASDYDYSPIAPPVVDTEILNTNFNDGTNQGWQTTDSRDPTNWEARGGFLVRSGREASIDIDTGDLSVSTYELTFHLSAGASNFNPTDLWVSWGGEDIRHVHRNRGAGGINETITITVPATEQATTELKFRAAEGTTFRFDNVRVNKIIPADENIPFDQAVEDSHVHTGTIEASNGDIEERTISLSFRPSADNDLSERQVLFTEGGGDGGFIIYIQGNTLYAGAHNGADWSGEYLSVDISSLDTSQWHNVAFTLDGPAGSIEAFLNGVSFGSSSNAQILTDVLGGAGLGGAGSVNKYHDGVQQGVFSFDGDIDEVRVYDRVLTNQEINALVGGADSRTDSFDYTIQDQNGEESTSTLDISVNAPDSLAPVLSDDALTVIEGQLVAVNSVASQGLLGNDRDADGDTLTLTEVGGVTISGSGITNIIGQHGTLIVASDGTYSYTPLDSTTSGTDVFSYTVSDGATTSTASLRVTIIPNDFANADSVTISESALPSGAIYVLDEIGSTEYLNVVNTETGVTHRLGPISGATDLKAIALSPTGTLYGADQTNIYTVNPVTQATTVIGRHGLSVSSVGDIAGLTVAPNGTVYASTTGGNIYSVNTETGAVTSIGNVSFAGLTGIQGDLAWHDGALYVQAHDSSNNFQFVRVDPEVGNTTFTALDGTTAGFLNGLSSVNGELVAIAGASTTPLLAIIDTDTGMVGEWGRSTGLSQTQSAAAIEQGVQGNVLSNDVNGQIVTTVELPDGTSKAVTSDGVTLQGVYGTLTIKGDGTYIYNIDNSLDSTNNLASGETGNERFIYTATDSDGATAQSILTVFVNGTNEVQVADDALITDFTMVDSIDASSRNIPVDFVATTQNTSDKITEIRIGKPPGTVFNIPSEWTDAGTVTGNDSSSTELVWTVTPGINAGLDGIDAITDGLTLSSWSGTFLNIAVTVSEYDQSGSLTDSWSTTSSVTLSLVDIDRTLTGGDGADILTGRANENSELIGGAGHDTLTGGDGQDFFVWEAGHEGTAQDPATDVIANFDATTFGDVLDLRELLPENASGHLDEFLSFSFDDGDTTIGISTTAGGPVVQNIVLDGVDLSTAYGTTDVTQLTNQLTDNGNLLS